MNYVVYDRINKADIEPEDRYNPHKCKPMMYQYKVASQRKITSLPHKKTEKKPKRSSSNLMHKHASSLPSKRSSQ